MGPDDHTEGGVHVGSKDFSYWEWKNADGKYHRCGDKPAIIYSDGTKEWWENGKRHRARGPAFIDVYGNYGYYFRGMQHNLEGPAGYSKQYGSTKILHHGN